MKQFIQWQLLVPDSVNGYKVQVTNTYTSTKKEDIDMLVKWLSEKYGNVTIIDGGDE